MRHALICLLLAPALARADEPPILSLEVRLSGGLTLAEASSSAMKPAPLGIGVGAEYAAIAYPWTSIYGNVYLDTMTDVGMGVAAGLRFRPQSGWMRFGIGGKALLIPSMKAGIQAAFGACMKPGNTHFCLDIEGTAFVVGDELQQGQVDAQLGIALEVGLDVL